MKKMVFLISLSIGGWVYGQGSLGEIIGSIVNSTDLTAIEFAKVWVEDNGIVYKGTSDLDGRFRISAVPAGAYMLNVATESDTMRDVFVQVAPDGFGNTGVIKFQKILEANQVNIVGSRTYMELKNQMTSIPVFTLAAKDISRSSVKFSIVSLAASMTSDLKVNDDGEMMFRGSRSGDMLYLIDGVKTASVGPLPSCAINNMIVYAGGIPAKYGDTMGGVIVLETKSYFDLYRERNQ
jgi:hypothetical protein